MASLSLDAEFGHVSFFDHELPRKKPAFPSMSGWLSHRSNSSQSSQIRISEPISNRRFKAVVTRTLGMGAQIVRTPTDALVPANYEQEEEEDEDIFDLAPRFSRETGRTEYCPPSPPPPPPATTQRPLHRHNTPPKPKREPPLPPTPETSPLRPALKVASPTALSPVELPPLPSFRPISGFTVNSPPSGVATAVLQPPPPFSPVLVAPCCTPDLSPAQILVRLETASSSLCTTMHTLTAISSRLSEYLTALVPPGTSPSPPPSPTSPFSSAFQAHQEAMGLRTTTSDQKPSRMHIFLDRPSSPYMHVLAFLRSTTASARPTLPRGLLQMPASSATRMEALFELRDEARYLGMTILEKLCEEEISRRQAERSARHGHGSTAAEDVSVSSTEADHSSTGPVTVPNATERITSSSSNTSSEVGAAGAAAKQRRLYMHGSKSSEGVYTGSLGSRGGLGSRSVEHIPRNVFSPEPTTPTREMDPSIPRSNINAGVGIGGARAIRPLGLGSRQRSSSVTRPLPPISPGGRI